MNTKHIISDDQRAVYTATHITFYASNRSMTPSHGSARYGIEAGLKAEIESFQSDWRDVVEWGVRLINWISDERVPAYKRNKSVMPTNADEALAAISTAFENQRAADLDEQQGGYDDDPAGFSDWSSATVVDGKVTDPWGDADMTATCRWFLDNDPMFTIWCAYQRVKDACDEAVLDNMGAWTDSDNDGADIGKVANGAFENTVKGLCAYIDERLAEKAQTAAA